MAFKKDKFGWVKLSDTATTYYHNSKYPNFLCYRLKVPGVLYPWGIRSGKMDDSGFEFDDLFNAEGFACAGKLGATLHAKKYQSKYKEAA
jgi:hypothetical protein|tara:strand:- start:1549 stop:1818 length:270 start_codon:yes stop_codon:yes gene_type:complete